MEVSAVDKKASPHTGKHVEPQKWSKPVGQGSFGAFENVKLPSLA